MNMKSITEIKLIKLKEMLKSLGSVVIAFSGGTDSTFLLHIASQISGLKVIAVTIKTPYFPCWEMKEAIDFCSESRIEHRLIELPFPGIIRNNPVERCYLCKKRLFKKIVAFAGENGYEYVEGLVRNGDKKSFAGVRSD
jgi:uncharacterized protein